MRHRGTSKETIMNVAAKLGMLVLAATPLIGLADDQPKLSCKDVTYSKEFLTHYPKAGAACREVVMKDGEKWVRFDADVSKVQGDEVSADIRDKYNNTVSTLTVKAAADARVMVSGKETKYSSLAAGDHLTIWMPESKLGFYAKPGASEAEKLSVVKRTEPER
jgi:hypothetical protein